MPLKSDSLVNNAFLIFEAKKAKADYHQQFDFEVFHTWFQKQLLPILPSRCLIILDRCPFHMVSKDRTTPSQMKKASLPKWLTQQGIHWDEKWLRPRLAEEVEERRDKKHMVES